MFEFFPNSVSAGHNLVKYRSVFLSFPFRVCCSIILTKMSLLFVIISVVFCFVSWDLKVCLLSIGCCFSSTEHQCWKLKFFFSRYWLKQQRYLHLNELSKSTRERRQWHTIEKKIFKQNVVLLDKRTPNEYQTKQEFKLAKIFLLFSTRVFLCVF